MRAVVVHEVGSYELEDLPVPEPGPGEVLIRVTVTGLCRTDLKLIRNGHRDLVTPRVPGEEVVGSVETLGPEVEQAWLDRRVYVYPGTSCGTCRECRRGAENLCREMRIMGFHRDGGFAGSVVAPVAALIPIPDGLSDEEAVFAEPLSCCLNALELGGVSPGDVVGIWGAGTAGTLLSRAVTARGAEPVVMETDSARRRPPPAWTWLWWR
jgi:L-iditol 2-dehydrogenase